MPELPEVETIRRGLEPRISGRRVVEAGSHPSAKFTPARELTGATIGAVGRRGKYLLIALDPDREMVLHLGMTGQLAVDDGVVGDGEEDVHLRAWWQLDDGARLTFRDVRRFGRIRVVPRGDYTSIATLRDIGPEPLDEAFTPESLWTALKRSRRRVKTQLLSQRPVAGVGNIYADEAFWLAKVDPGLRRITRAQAEALHAGITQAIEQGLSLGGTTLRDYRGFDGAEGSNQTALLCYGRAGWPCPRCGTELVSRVLDARTTTSCPDCQPRR